MWTRGDVDTWRCGHVAMWTRGDEGMGQVQVPVGPSVGAPAAGLLGCGSTSVESSDLRKRDLTLLELTNGAAYFCSLRARNRMGLGEAAVSDRLVPFQMGLRGWQTSLVVIGAVIAATLFCMAGWALWLRHICDFSTARDREKRREQRRKQHEMELKVHPHAEVLLD